MTQVTDKMVEAAKSHPMPGSNKVLSDFLDDEEIREILETALTVSPVLSTATAALSALTQGGVKGEVNAEREHLAQEARRYASHYPEASDGRNTFILFAEMIERRMAMNADPSHPNNYPDDGSCVRCGSVPRNTSGLCATCLDEDAEREGEIQSQDDVPIAWMKAEHIDQYADGTADGIAWANNVETDFYTVPLYLHPDNSSEAVREALEAAARYHDDLAAQHEAFGCENSHHELMAKSHRRDAAAIRSLSSPDHAAALKSTNGGVKK